ncbi:MAG: lipoprotein-releasing ABC transporter permease subunit [Gammaproteobacteria bacterium]|nr:lipoprotein-releasing ABC transporter permease subunit [Gammaproteobacteria bacterium]
MSSHWYEWLVGLRYVRSRGVSRFVSFISGVSMAGIGLGVAVLIVVLSVMNGFEAELRERILAMTAHATVTGLDGRLAAWQEARSQALADPRVLEAAPFLSGEGMLVNGDAVSGAMVQGIDPVMEQAVAKVGDAMQKGRLDQLVEGDYSIVLGSALAEHLRAQVGDTVILVIAQGQVTPAGLMPRMRRFTVSGIFEIGMYEYDRHVAYIHMADAGRLYRTGEGVTGLRLKLEDMFLAPQVVRDVARSLGGSFYVSDWTREHRNFFRSIQVTKRIMFVILLLIVAVAAFNIVSTLVMVVQDKQADIAIFRTLGAAPRSILAVFMIQGLVVGLVGTLGGMILGVLVAFNLEQLVSGLESVLGIDLLAADVYFISDLPARVNWGEVGQICLFALGISLLSTIYPAWKAARTQPAEALRYD